jgi:carbamoyltransferase
MSLILGIGCGTGHDSGATILLDNKIIASIEEERLTRLKHDGSYPLKSIDFCINEASAKYGDINTVIIGWNPFVDFLQQLNPSLFDLKNPRSFFGRAKFIKKNYEIFFAIKKKTEQLFPKSKIFYIEHHLAHSASAFLLSNFESSNIFSLDGSGEFSCGHLSTGDNFNINIKKKIFFPNSLGLVYSAFTQYLGFKIFDEYKVMGLAAYGQPKYLDQMRDIIKFDKKKGIKINLNYFRHYYLDGICDYKKYYSDLLDKKFGINRISAEYKIEEHHMNLASSLQHRLNEVVIEMANDFIKINNNDNLCLAGGVCLNGVMNYKIFKECNIKNIFIQPASNDGGISLGAASYGYNILLNNKKKIEFKNAFFGNQYSEQYIKEFLQKNNVKTIKLKDPALFAAKLIYKQNIIGWFQGKSEIGPRALGARSILADPRKAENQNIVNTKIKFREEFRPFAPSVLEEHTFDWFELETFSPYMLLITQVKHEKRHLIPAVTHVDGTARPQTVNKESNFNYYTLINHFYKLSNCPIVLNTSFNLAGEPLVNSPEDAVKTFFNSGLDFLIIENFLIFNNNLEKIKDLLDENSNI